MSLSLKERRVVVKEIPVRYKKVKKKEKGKILDEFVKLTGYNRCYASYLLRTYEKKVVIYGKDGIRRVFIAVNEYRGRKDKNKKRSIRRGCIECTDISMAFIRFSLWQEARSLHKENTAPFNEIRQVAH